MDVQATIDDFLAGKVFAVAGASRDRAKYGNKVLRCYLQNDLVAWPVHPSEAEIEGVPCSPDLASLPEAVHGLSIVTPPAITATLVEEAAKLGIKRLWMQPGAESNAAIARAKELGLTLIAGGPCILVALGYKE
jgi:predicted CoA-binding protein